MFNSFKKCKLYISISMLVQALSFISLFFLLYKKKKSNAGVFLAVGSVAAVIGAYFMLLQKLEDNREYAKAFGDLYNKKYDFPEEDFDFDFDHSDTNDEDDADEDEPVTIPVDDTASEDEFR